MLPFNPLLRRWRAVLVDQRNHGKSGHLRHLHPPHNLQVGGGELDRQGLPVCLFGGPSMWPVHSMERPPQKDGPLQQLCKLASSAGSGVAMILLSCCFCCTKLATYTFYASL